MSAQPSTHHFRDDEDGVSFPLVDGSRSTSATGKGVFADAARVADDRLAEQIASSANWRRDYLEAARRLLEASLTTVHHPTSMSMAGLQSLHDRFVFVHQGEEVPLGSAVQVVRGDPIDTVVIPGEGTDTDAEGLSVPYRGSRLAGDALHRQLDAWSDAGTIEPTFADAVRTVMANPDWLDLSDQTVVILGAGAEMGPLHSLSRWGATVVPIDLERPLLWERILAHVRRGRGRAVVPVRHPVDTADDDVIAATAGVNLITDMPRVAAWLAALDGPLVLGNYLYADGATHVRVNMAADAITEHLLNRRDDVALAVLATPTDVFAVPEETVESSRRRAAGRRAPGMATSAARTLSRGRLFAPNYPHTLTTPAGLRLGVADCLVAQQGPNYALAKRLQRWRAATAREQGVVTSINVAPPTRTRSVMKNRALAAAYAGAGAFGVEVFDPSTSNTLMAAMLVHDLRNQKSVAQPSVALEHPHQLFWHGAAHGGLWRNPYAARSVLGLAVVLGMVPRGA